MFHSAERTERGSGLAQHQRTSAVRIYGRQMNVHDSERLRGLLRVR